MMKSIGICAVLVIFLAGCEHATAPAASDMYVNFEIEQAFQDDLVALSLDNQPLLQTRITTNYSVDLAWSSGYQKLSRRKHSLSFEVIEYGVRRDYLIDTANDSSTVLLRFDKATKQIQIEQMKGRMMRD